MTVLSDTSIKKAVLSGELSILPFHDDALQPASYDMRLYWKILISPMRHENGRTVDLRKEPNHTFFVEPGRFVGILTEEKISLPLSMVGRFGLRSEFTRHGLVAFGGIQIDPGFKGRLAISLFHAGPELIPLKLGRKMFTVEFNQLADQASKGYDGPFQNQSTFHKMQKDFILNAHTTSLAEINTLPSEIASIQHRLTMHETFYHPKREFPSISELAKAQGVSPINDITELSGLLSEEDDIDTFLETVQKWRRGNNNDE
ncbi:MAG: dCTP deaminase [Chloroflexi bacterium RBG_13_46_14]|nr:MAG: dCTP deaminase [Chloroflexi bacterium RBG_13_46_14]